MTHSFVTNEISLPSIIMISHYKQQQERSYSLACLEIKSRNEEAINSTRNSIYSQPLKGFLLPTLSTSILFIWFWIDLVRVLATTGNTSAVAGYAVYKYTKIPWHVISIIAENKPHAHHKSNLHTMKVYNTRPSQFCFFSRPLRSVYLFQSNQRFQAIEFVDRHVSEKL